MSAAGGVRLGVDVGGTFTDLVALVDGAVTSTKVLSTPHDQSEGVIRALELAGLLRGAIAVFAHGSTVATNALLERRGARTALVTTEGFADLLEIGRQNRPALYDLAAARPPPLVPRGLRFTVRERMGPDGELEPLDEASLRRAVEAVARAEVDAVAVCLLFSFLHPAHERVVGQALREALPQLPVSLSCEVLPEFREYERCATTVADAYLAPRLGAYLRRLGERARAAGIPEPLVMRSSGGVVEADVAARSAAACVLSGPAGGVVGAAHVARASGLQDVLSFDMGGTSTDVAPIRGGAAQTTTEAEVAGVPLRLPAVDVHTVSAGGGSIAWADAGGALRVGPRSAGAEPGPAAYGRGGEEPTVTDANLLLGYLADGARLGGEVELSRARAEAALDRVGAPLGLDALACARGVIAVANAEMARALRVISVQRGLDPRAFALVAFGGAGGLHACALADELAIATVLLPRAAGVLSALGLAISDLRRDFVVPLPCALDELGEQRLEAAFAELERRARAELRDPRCTRQADLRYRGQSFELTIDAGADAGDGDPLRERLHRAHDERYGYRMDAEPVELVALRLVASTPVPAPELRALPPAAAASPQRGSRRALLNDAWHEAAVLDGAALEAGAQVDAPAIVELPEATFLVPPGWSGRVDDTGSLLVERR